MSILVGKRKLTIYDIDTEDTIFERIMTTFMALPNYAYLTPKFSLETTRYELVNFFELIKKFNSIIYSKFYKAYEIEINNAPEDFDDIIDLFVIIKYKDFQDIHNQLALEEDLQTYFNVKRDISYLARTAEETLSKFRNESDKLREKNSNFKKVAAEFQKLEEFEEMTNRFTDRFTLKAVFQRPPDVYVQDLFNSSITSDFIPLYVFNDFFKYYNDSELIIPKQNYENNVLLFYIMLYDI